MDEHERLKSLVLPPPLIAEAVSKEFIQSVQLSLPVRKGDVLSLASFSSIASAIIRVVTRIYYGGDITTGTFFYTTDGTRTAQALAFDLTDGILIGVQISVASGTLARGQCFVKGQILQGVSTATVQIGIIGNYVTTNNQISWPTSPVISSLDGVGFLQGTNATLGAGTTNQAFQTPINTQWRVLQMEAFVVTSAVPGNRSLSLHAQLPGPTTIFISQPRFLFGPGVTRRVDFGKFFESSAIFTDALGNSQLWVTMPEVLIKFGGFITLSVDAADAADTLAGVMSFEELLNV